MNLRAPAALTVLVLLSAFVQSDVIEWSSNRFLQWSDFHGTVPRQAQYGAAVHYEVQSISAFIDRQHISHEVKSIVVKSKSWVKPENRGNMVLLDHERLHFDIAECNARMLRSRLRALASYDECIHRTQAVRDSINAVWNQAQQRYDLETAHGTIAKEQARWANKVAHTLDSLAAYSEPRFVVELKP